MTNSKTEFTIAAKSQAASNQRPTGIMLACSSSAGAGPLSPIPLNGDVCANLKAAKQLGFDALEIHARELHTPETDQLLRLKADYDMRISALVTGKLCTEGKKTLTHEDAANRTAAIEGVRRYIELARLMETDLVIGWLRGSRREDVSEDEYEALLAEALIPLEAEAAEAGVRIMIEGINRYEINTMNTAAQMLRFIGRFGLNNTYVHLDTFHMNIEEPDMSAAIRSCGSKLGYLHVADNTRRYPGSGSIDFNSVVSSLLSIGYSGYIDLECLPKPNAKEAAIKGLAHISAAINNALNEANYKC